MNTWSYGPIGCQMHFRTQVDALFYQADLLLILIVTLGDDGLDERHGSLSRLSGRLHPEQFPEPHLVVTAIGRQEVDRLSLGTGFVDIVLQLLHGHRVADADLRTLILQRRLCTCPDDIIDGEFIAKHNLAVLIHIDDGSQTSVVESEEIEKRAVLTERIGVIGIVHAYLVVSQEEQQSATHILLQLSPAADISAFFNLHVCSSHCRIGSVSILKSHLLSYAC